MALHSKLSPSASDRWMVCTGSVNAIAAADARGEIVRTPNKYSAEGTVAHMIGEQCLRKDLDPEDFRGKKYKEDGFTFTVDDDMIESVEVYVNYVRDHIADAELQADIKVELQIEVKRTLTHLGVDGLDGGTSDTILIAREHQYIEIVDYKHGAGVVVQPEMNPQIMQYGLGVLEQLNITEFDDWLVHLTIVQPRAFDPAGKIRSFTITAEDLYAWQHDVLIPKAKETEDPNAPLVASDKGCRFCPLRGNCPALYELVQNTAMIDFMDLEPDLPDINTLTPEQKVSVMQNAGIIRAFIVAVENQMKVEMDTGSVEYNDTHKLVLSTTKRSFTEDAFDEDFSELFDYLDEEEIFVQEQKNKGIGAIEKALIKKVGKETAKEIMDEITTKPKGQTVIAPLSDSRTAISPSVVSDFEGLGD